MIDLATFFDAARPFGKTLDAACVEHGYSQIQAYTQICAESAWDPFAASPVGAIGLCQIIPSTALAWGVDPHDPVASIRAMVRAMSGYEATYERAHARFPKNTPWELALSAYNAGPGAVVKYAGIPPFAETETYVDEITAAANKALSSGAWAAIWRRLVG